MLFEPVRQQMVEIVTTECRVATGGHHLKHPAMQAQDGDIEGSATQVADGVTFLAWVEAIGDGGRRGFVEQPQYADRPVWPRPWYP